MKKILTGLVCGTALLGLAACGESDNTTTQSVEPDATQTTPATPPAATPPADTPPADTGAGGGAGSPPAQ